MFDFSGPDIIAKSARWRRDALSVLRRIAEAKMPRLRPRRYI
jgi:hypothetical protein